MKTMKTIKARHPVRNAFSAHSSGARYYDTKGQAIHAFEYELLEYDLNLDYADCNNWHGDEGRQTVAILTDDDGPDGPSYCIGHAIFTWHRMDSGRWEIIGYIG